MALNSEKKLWCLDYAIKIAKAYASSEQKEQSPEIVLKKSYDTLKKLREDVDLSS